MKKILTAAAFVIACACGCAAQTIVNMPVAQNPLFEVSTNSVTVSIPDNGGATLGGDLAITGGSGSYTYRWYNNSGATLGSSSTLEVSGPGTYLLDIDDTCDCRQTVTFNVATAGLDDVALDSFSISPNPTDGLVEIRGFEAMQICAVSLSGKMVALIVSEDGAPIADADFSSLASGTYILCLTDRAGNNVSTKLIKK